MRFLKLSPELAFGAEYVGARLPDTDHITVRFEKAPCFSVHTEGETVVIGYSRTVEAFRGMSMAKRLWESGERVEQTAKFDSLVCMVDCSRNAVLKPEAVKQLLVELAMLGFTGVMLYTEDTYEIPGQPYFGHMRGRYTVDEMKELDAFAGKLGMELIPCIQTLAHLNAIFRWSAYNDVHDTEDILLADYEPTYQLIEQMLRTCRACFTTNRINIGMDEAHQLGRGRYLDKNGYSPKPEIMLRHLQRVVELCKKYGYEPVMWSDMFFRMQFGGAYQVEKGELSQQVLDKIPEGVELCYWDYYTPPAGVGRLEHMFSQHARIPNDLWFAGGSWSWSGITPKNYFSNQVTPTQLAYAAKYGVKNIIATIWGDDGAECSVFAVLPSLLQYGELNYGDANEEVLEARSRDCFGLSYADFLKLDQPGKPRQLDPDRKKPTCYEKMALYNDVLMGLLDADLQDMQLAERFTEDAALLRSVPENRYSLLFDTQLCYAELLAAKTDLSARIKAAYRGGNKKTLADIAREDLPQVGALLEKFHNAFRDQWMAYNKPFGFEVQDIRLGGLQARLQTAKLRLEQYLHGEVERLEELEQPDLPLSPKVAADSLNRWGKSVTASVIAW